MQPIISIDTSFVIPNVRLYVYHYQPNWVALMSRWNPEALTILHINELVSPQLMVPEGDDILTMPDTADTVSVISGYDS